MVVGKPQVGDVAQIHLDASYTSMRPLFRIGLAKFAEKERKKDFLSTHIIGSTAFFDLVMTKNILEEHPAAPTTFRGLLALCARDMVLNESASFVFDVNESSKHDWKKIVTSMGKEHRGHFANVPDTVLTVTLKIDMFRIQRYPSEKAEKRKSHHYRIDRNGRGGRMPGSFNM